MKSNLVLSRKEKVGPEHFLFTFTAPSSWRVAKPGQFLHIQCGNFPSLILRRPFSIHFLKEERKKTQVGIIFKVVGKGTKYLSQRKIGEIFDTLGPLGKPFYISHPPHVLIAGGMGIAPLYFLALALFKKREKFIVLIGAKNKEEVLREKEFRLLGGEIFIATEDGSKGKKGLVTDLMDDLLSTLPSSSSFYACGPISMMREVWERCKKKKFPLQVSLEQFMGCGIGACLSCVIKTHTGYQRVCKEGPVFKAEEIEWEKL